MSSSEIEKLKKENESLRRSLDLLAQVTKNMVSTLDLDELLETLLNRLIEATNADGGAIAIFDDGNLTVKTSSGILKKEDFVGTILYSEDSFSWRIINENRVIFQKTTQSEAKLLKKARELGIKASLGIPLKSFDKTVGAISIHWLKPDPPVDDEIIHLLEITAERAAMAIINAKLFKHVKAQAELIDLSPDAILIRDLNDIITLWNKSAEKIYGWTREEATGKKITDLLYKPEQLETYFKIKEITLKEGQWSGELEHKTKEGKTITVLARFKLLHDNAGNPSQIIVVNSDITEKKKVELILNRAQRLETVGRLASGIVHDLKNILQPISMATSILGKKLTNQSDLRMIEIIESSIQRGNGLLNQILSFSKGISGEKGAIQVKHLIREIEMILKETFPKSIKIEVEASSDLSPIIGDPNQINQILMNLCINARDAMPHGGTLKIKAQNLSLEKHYATQVPGIKPGPYILITVEDTGTGIPQEIIDKIFDPFFTTKESGKGTGLGLSIVSNIVKEYGGFINVYSEMGKGTIFKVYLPAVEEKIKVETEHPEEEIPLGDGELILVVDDEAPILEILKLSLENNNYKVITAINGAEALVKFAQRKDEIKLLITDLAIPIINGAELIKTISRISPKLKIIATGGLETPSSLIEIRQHISNFIQKPFDSTTLLREVTKALKS